ncbi:hypothetical protein C0991_003967 [Blastosporella zonata]|nr:hypothetical protein C0991_003967 [Blastosporella zonata]
MSFPMGHSPQPKDEPGPEPELDELEEDLDSEDENPNVFKIRGALPEYQERKLTIRQLHDVVWTEAKQMALIHSIFHNFYIPPIVFAVHPAEDDPNDEVRVCVDGKQRLTSIQKFCDGQIPYKDPRSKKQWWYTLPQTSRGVKAEIPEVHRDRFVRHLMTCVEYHSLPEGAEHEVFQRVQMGMVLTAAEKLQALSSPWAQWIRDLEHRHVSVDGGLATVLEWDIKRGRDFQNIAYFVCCCDYLPDKDEIPTAASITKWIAREDPPLEQFKNDINKVLVDFWNIGNDDNYNYGLKNIGTRISPAEFIFIGVLLFLMRKKSMEDRATAIKALRTGIRAQYRDIRLNSAVCKSMWSIIRRVQNTSSTSHAHDDTKGKKRRKDDDDADDDYRPTPVTGLNRGYTRSKKRTILS